MKNLIIGTFAALGASVCAAATPAATLLFAQEGTQIIDASGVPRAAKQGDSVQSGERVVTAAGGISQLQLPDGSLIGVRPSSELRLTAPDGPSPAPVVALIQGAARLIGSELMDTKKLSNITFQSGVATLRLQGADLESAVVRADKGTNPTPGAAPGSYQRLLIGSGDIQTGAQLASLTPRQVSFVGTTAAAPVVVASAMPALSLGARVPAASLGVAFVGSKGTQPAPIAPINTLGVMAIQNPTGPTPIGTGAALTTIASVTPITPVVTPPPTAPILTAVFVPTAPIVITTNVLPPPPILVQPIITLAPPILNQPIVTKPPVCTRLISGKCI